MGFVRDQLDPLRSGLVISGPKALRKASELRDRGYTGVLVADPALYEDGVATAQEPYLSRAGELPSADPLGQAVQEQLAVGSTAALTPTGYLMAGDTAAVRAAVRDVAAREDPRIVLALPIDVGWLRDDLVGRLIEELAAAPGAKAVMLGGQLDPLASFPEALTGLTRVLAEVPGTALLRADLAAFGALARGAVFAAYGLSGRFRHVVPPGEPAKSSGFADSPAVLFPELMALFLGKTLARRFAATHAPVCECAACGRRPLDSFPGNRDARSAAQHNTAVLLSWQRTLQTLAVGPDRQRWWQERCRAAVDRYPLINAAIRQPNGFTVQPQLLRWSLLDAVPSAPAGAGAD
ncbi:hypothetical protein F7Q99_26420 [Streptomyces kaniharaensis]|uniref:Uncharacterized protein n=1 Tax=Streptomyces kaniharaensis TaxID=212423 RepID=A0A6N7KZM0_9ACTN|nr:hypothetical protein [Streptomyces kaniharaensis]MQS15708.1 hypothetical protein [Streptomyces kaniharaensis]